LISCKIGEETKGFRCTGSDESKTWDKLHALPKNMNCEHCANEAQRIFNGIHDLVNLGLGKEPHTITDFNYLVSKINTVKTACSKDGRC